MEEWINVIARVCLRIEMGVDLGVNNARARMEGCTRPHRDRSSKGNLTATESH
jgi:hypothetical protein